MNIIKVKAINRIEYRVYRVFVSIKIESLTSSSVNKNVHVNIVHLDLQYLLCSEQQ